MNYRFKHRLTGNIVVLNDVASAEVKNGTVLREDYGYDVAADVPYIRFVYREGFIVYAFANVSELEVSDGREFIRKEVRQMIWIEAERPATEKEKESSEAATSKDSSKNV